jgi:hypothetical protein
MAREKFGGLGVEREIILKLILKKRDVIEWTEFTRHG